MKTYRCITGLANSQGYVPARNRVQIEFKSSARSERTLHNAAMRAARKYWHTQGMDYHDVTVSHIVETM